MKKAVTDVGTSKYQFTKASGSNQQSSLGIVMRSPTDEKKITFYMDENSCFGTIPPTSA